MCINTMYAHLITLKKASSDIGVIRHRYELVRRH